LFGLSGLVLAKLAAPAFVVALSPVPIVLAVLLLLHNDQPYSSSIAYLGGRLVSLTALTTAFVQVPRFLDGLGKPAPAWTDWVVVAAGIVLVVLGGWLWWRHTGATRNSRWEPRVGRITPTMAAMIGMFPLLANPKVLAASAAAGTAIATIPSTVTGTAAAIAFYAVLANSTVAAPVVAYLLIGPRIEPHLHRIRRWIHVRQLALTAVTLVVVGFAVVAYGFA
jgi:hypothetical protein